MEQERRSSHVFSATAAALLVWGAGNGVASATEPCGDFGECKTLIEINASDGDIGFHFLFDGDDLVAAKMKDPKGKAIYENETEGRLRKQKITENFVESAEPLCFDPKEDDDPDNDGEIFVTLEQFLKRWIRGTYRFIGSGAGDDDDDDDDDGATSRGTTVLTHDLPAAPADVDFDGSVISWDAGDDLGECADADELEDLVDDGILPTHPEDVPVDAWEIVLEPDVEDGDPTGSLVYSVRVAGDISPKEVTVPEEYLASLPDDTPVKIEVGAIGGEDNATFTEEDGFCVNEDDGCAED